MKKRGIISLNYFFYVRSKTFLRDRDITIYVCVRLFYYRQIHHKKFLWYYPAYINSLQYHKKSRNFCVVIIKSFYDFAKSEIRARCARSMVFEYCRKRWRQNHKNVLWYICCRIVRSLVRYNTILLWHDRIQKAGTVRLYFHFFYVPFTVSTF